MWLYEFAYNSQFVAVNIFILFFINPPPILPSLLLDKDHL